LAVGFKSPPFYYLLEAALGKQEGLWGSNPHYSTIGWTRWFFLFFHFR